MIDQLLGVAAGIVAIATFFCARVLQHLHTLCPDTRAGCVCNRGLLRWYVQGFDRPMRIAQALVLTSMALLIASLAIHASPLLVISFVTLMALSYLQSHQAAAHQRQLRCALSRAPANS